MDESNSKKQVQLQNGRYKIMHTIDEGAYGKVYQVLDQKEKKKKAIKSINNCHKDTIREISILKEVADCPHVVKIYESFLDGVNYYIVMDYHKYGNLEKVIENEQTRIPAKNIKRWINQLLMGLDFIHSLSIIHRDLKPANILLNNYGDLLLCDFGVSIHMDSLGCSCKGSINYASPQVLESKPYTVKTDIWSLGCVAYELFTLRKAFPDSSMFNINKKILACDFQMPNFENDVRMEFIIKNTIKIDERERLSARKLLDHLERFKMAKYNYKIGEDCLKNVDYDTALTFFKRSLKLLQETDYENKLEIASTFDKIGQCHQLLIDYDNALKCFTIAYDMRENHLKDASNKMPIFNSLINLGDCSFLMKNYPTALDHYFRANKMIENMIGSSSGMYRAELAKSLGRIGKCLFQDDGKEDESLGYNQQSLELYQKLHENENNEELARVLNQVGNSYAYLKNPNPNKALQYIVRAYEMRLKCFGNVDHPDVADSLADLGAVYRKLNNNQKALEYYQDSLKMNQSLYKNKDHPKIQVTLTNIGSLHFKMDDFHQALDSYLKSFQMSERLINYSKQGKLVCLRNILSTYKKLNDTENCAKYQAIINEIEMKSTIVEDSRLKYSFDDKISKS